MPCPVGVQAPEELCHWTALAAAALWPRSEAPRGDGPSLCGLHQDSAHPTWETWGLSPRGPVVSRALLGHRWVPQAPHPAGWPPGPCVALTCVPAALCQAALPEGAAAGAVGGGGEAAAGGPAGAAALQAPLRPQARRAAAHRQHGLRPGRQDRLQGQEGHASASRPERSAFQPQARRRGGAGRAPCPAGSRGWGGAQGKARPRGCRAGSEDPRGCPDMVL